MKYSVYVSSIQAYIFTATGATGVIANTLQLIFIIRVKYQKKSLFALTLLNLNVADLLASTSILIRGLLFFFTVQLSHILVVALIFSLMSSFSHVVFIAIQRAIAVAFPLKVKQILTKRRCYVVLVLLWLVSIAMAIVVFFELKAGITSIACSGIAVGIALMVIYSIISYKMVKQKRINIARSVGEGAQKRQRKSERDVLVYSIAVTLVFIICFFPKAISYFVKYPTYLTIACEFVYSINPFLDTLLYFMLHYCRRERGGPSLAVSKQRESPATALHMTTRL